jgi:FMN reductase (NADPH)
MNDVLKTLNGHRSIRRFNDEKISEETVKLITDATLRAPTAGNMMMYSMIVIKNKKTLEKLSKTCDHQAFIKTADTAIICLNIKKKLLKEVIQMITSLKLFTTEKLIVISLKK